MMLWVPLLVIILFIGLIRAAVTNNTSTRIAAMGLGILGGLVGALAVYNSIYWLHPRIAREEFLAMGLFFPIIGIVGGILALTRPAVAGALMLVSGIGSVIAVAVFLPPFWHQATYDHASFALITGGALSLVAREKGPATGKVATVLGIVGGFLSTLGSWSYIEFLLRPGRVLGAEVLIFWVIFWGLLPLMAIAGGILALRRPGIAATLMLASGTLGLGGFVATGFLDFMLFYVFVGLLLILGSALALASCEKRQQKRLSS